MKPAGRPIFFRSCVMGRTCALLLAPLAVTAALPAGAADPPAAERPVVEVGSVSVRPVSVESWIQGSIVSRSDARIASVLAGRVIWVAEVGTRVGQGEPIARLDDTVMRLRLEDLRAQVAHARAQQQFNNSQLERFDRLAATQAHPGQIVTVRDHGVEKSGRVRTVVPVGDDRSRQFEVRVTLPSPEWLVGTSIEVSLPSAAVRTAVTVPRDALVIRQNHAYVLRLPRTDTVAELDVTPGAGIADVVEVRGPLSAGDRLVVRGGERLAAGQAVRVIDRTPRATATMHPG